MSQLTVRKLTHWAGFEAKEKPDTGYLDGMHVDHSRGRRPSCVVDLRYPSPGYVRWEVSCPRCGQRAETSGVGRVDDPRTFRVACLRPPRRWWQFWRWREA